MQRQRPPQRQHPRQVTPTPARTPTWDRSLSPPPTTSRPPTRTLNQALVYNNVIRLNVFNSLVRYGRDLVYVPDLAEKWENPDEQTYVFHLRQGVKYHNGQEVEASHVEYSFKRIADKKAVFAIARGEYRQLRGRRQIHDQDAPDSAAGRLHRRPRRAQHRPARSRRPTSIRSPSAAGPSSSSSGCPTTTSPCSASPATSNQDLAKVEKIVFRIIPDPQVAITNLQAGAIDGILDVPLAQAATVQVVSDHQSRSSSRPAASTSSS